MKILLEKAASELMQMLKTTKGKKFNLDSIIIWDILPKLKNEKISSITKGTTENALIGKHPAASIRFGEEEIRLAVANNTHNVSGVAFEHLTPSSSGKLEVTTKAIFGNDGQGYIEQLALQPNGSRFVVSRSSDVCNGCSTFAPYRAIEGAPKITTLGSGMTIV